MPSEQRLHPLSFLFGIGAHLKGFALPILVLLVTTGRSGLGWQIWFLWLAIPYAVVAVGRTLSYRYRYDEHELVIRTGFLFRNERHVPYARIQSVDGVQNIVHRLLDVVEVKVQTAGGKEPEAAMSVLPLAAFEEMRRLVSARRPAAAPSDAAVPADATEATATTDRARILLALSPRELLLYGFVEGRGMVVIGTMLGVAWEFGFADSPIPWFVDRFVTDEDQPRKPGDGVFRFLARAIFKGGDDLLGNVVIGLATLFVFLIVVRLLSMAWAAVRLYGFTLTREGDDLRTAYGLLTRVEATIPLRRIQSLSLHEGPLHRLVGRVSARVDTAGSQPGQNAPPDRLWLAPLVAASELPALSRQVLPTLSLGDFVWQRVHPRARRRITKALLILIGLAQLPLAVGVGWWGLLSLGILLPWASLHGRRSAAAMAFAITDDLVAYRSGWLWRRTSIAPFARVQAVTLRESPFDRRHSMAGVSVDTAGASTDPRERIAIRYLDRSIAEQLHRQLAHEAARRTFRWR